MILGSTKNRGKRVIKKGCMRGIVSEMDIGKERVVFYRLIIGIVR